MIARIAAGLARNRAPEHRWRRAAVPVTAAVFMLLVLAATGIATMVQRETDRATQRTAVLAAEPSPTDLLLVARDDRWRGEQYSVVWIEPSSPGTKPVLPPGMAELPEPGQAVVSPALGRMGCGESGLASRYPERLVLGPEGVRGGGELLAYVRAPEGRTLAQDERAVRVGAFGPTTGEGRPYAFDMPSPVTVVPVVGGVIAVLVVPGLIVLAVGVAAASGVRDRRFEVLRYLGAPGRTLAALAVLETSILAVPGLVVCTLLWGAIGPRLGRVPLVGHELVHGDMMLPWWLLALELGACAAVVGLLALVTTSILRPRRTARSRPGSRRAAVTPLRAIPLVVAAAAFVLGKVVGGSFAANLNLVGIVAAVAGVPLVLPSVLRAAGARLGRLESVPASVAGRGMGWDPTRAARPFLGGAALVVLVLAGGGYVALARHVEAPSVPAAGGAQAVVVQWLDPRTDDPNELADAIGGGLVVPFAEGGHAHGQTQEHSDEHAHEEAKQGMVAQEQSVLEVGATCPRLAAHLPGTTCDPEAPFELPSAAEQVLAEKLSVAAHGPNPDIRLVPGEDVAVSGSAFVLDEAPLEVLEGRVRDAAVRTLPAPYVYSQLSMAMRESPIVPWIIGGTVVAIVALAIGCLVSLVDRLLSTRKHRRHLLNLGVAPRRLTALEAWLFAAPYGAVIAVSFSVGLATCAMMVGFSDISLPWYAIGTTLAVAIGIGLVGTASVAFFGARSMRESTE